MNLKKLLFLAFISFTFSSFCQTSTSNPLAKITGSSSDTSKKKFDKKIKDAYIGFGFVLGGDNAGAEINYGQSREFNIGVGLGRRLVKWDGVGFDIYYKSTDFFLTQDSTKILPNSIIHKDEKISFDNLGALVYDRFFIKKYFIDAGFYFDWTFYTKHITWDTYPNTFGSIIKVTEKQLDFTNADNYGLTFRAGMQTGLSLYFNYRLSSLFKGASSTYIAFPELPMYVLGVVFGLH